MSKLFDRFARWASMVTGRPGAFGVAACIILVWALTGPVFGFNNTWQLVINTSTTIVTFLMVFLIQNAQNRDTGAMQVKLDELIFAIKNADNRLLDLEELETDELEQKRSSFEESAAQARRDAPSEDGIPQPAAS